MILPYTTQDIDRQVPAFRFLPFMHMVTAGEARHIQVLSL